MSQSHILIADNDLTYLDQLKTFLQQEGFEVTAVEGATEALRVLKEKRVDLAIFDLRLVNDKDERDTSGLKLASVAPSIPKIILTRFPTVEAVREALGPQVEGLPHAVDFVNKQEPLQVLLTAIRQALELVQSRFGKLTYRIEDYLAENYKEAQRQARWNYVVSLVVSLAGMITIFIGVALSLGNMLGVGITNAIAGLIAETIALLFFKRADSANTRIDIYHSELLETRRFEKILVACDEMLEQGKKTNAKEKILQLAAERWLRAKVN